ncbi:MAG: STAS domain-containing protein [Streptomyces sp.]
MTASGRCVVARVSGEMDYTTDPLFRSQLTELIAQGDRFIVLDLSGVSFCDSAGCQGDCVNRPREHWLWWESGSQGRDPGPLTSWWHC